MSVEIGRALREVRGCLQRKIMSRRAVVGLLLGFFGAWGMGAGLINYCGIESGSCPYPLIAGSIILNFSLLGILLAMLPSRLEQWGYCSVWMLWTLFVGTSHAGLYLNGDESARTFVSLGLLTVAQGSVLTAFVVIGSVVFSGASFFSKQVCGGVLAVAVAAIFWTKTPIQSAPKNEAEDAVNWISKSDLYYDATLKLSPPLSIAAVWYQESDASKKRVSREGSRFDLVRGPLSYDLWMGSYQIMPYPAIYPQAATESSRGTPGVLVAFLVWALPLLCLGDLGLTLRLRYRKA